MSELDYFSVGNAMWKNVLNKDVETTPTFTIVDSHFSDPWYNFIVPLVPETEFDWVAAFDVIEDRKLKSVVFSFYIPSTLDKDSYARKLEKEGYSQLGEEIYLVKEIAQQSVDESLKFVPASDNPDLYKKMAVELFPEWENAADFSQHLLDKEAATQDTKVRSFIVFQSEKPIGMCAVIFNDVLGYMTNTGVLPEFRGKGLQKEMISFRENLLLTNGVSNAYAIVDAGTASWQNYINKGYQQWREYLVFTK